MPYSVIPQEHRKAYAEALGKEWSNAFRYGAVLDLEASRTARQEYPAARFLVSRACYRNKNAPKPLGEKVCASLSSRKRHTRP